MADEFFLLHGRKYRVSFDNQGISLTRDPGSACCAASRSLFQNEHCDPPPFTCSCCEFLMALSGLPVPFQEMLRAGIADAHHATCFPVKQDFVYKQASFLVVHTFRRGRRNPNSWQPLELVLEHQREEVVARWEAAINERIRTLSAGTRPRRVHVWINPYGGQRKAMQIWETTCLPIFESAGVKVRRTVTKAAGHARREVETMSLEDISLVDGFVVVGGDGLFGEVLNGILSVRAEGGPRAAAAARLRLGHIPAGSTDALAWTINGTRKPAAAALHVVLGDRTPIDCMRIDVPGHPPSFSCCIASAGFMGEVLHMSEKMRWAGPSRYDIAGAYAFVKHKTYSATVQYLPADEETGRRGDGEGCSASPSLRHCGSGCQICRQAVGATAGELVVSEVSPPWTRRSGELLEAEPRKVKTVEGKFKGLMCVVSPCRSDKSVHGILPHAHLADGCMWLIMVRQCNHLQYLRFLVALSTSGIAPGQLSFVEVVRCRAARIEPLGNDCRWNVDGESLPNRPVSCQVHRGLVEVFSRGVEHRCS